MKRGVDLTDKFSVNQAVWIVAAIYAFEQYKTGDPKGSVNPK